MIKLTGYLALVLLFSSCQPSLPTGVPQNASWAGGADGGAWILCESHDEGSYSCSIYNETGSLLKRDIFRFENSSMPSLDAATLKTIGYSSWDGVSIILINHQKLVTQSSEPR